MQWREIIMLAEVIIRRKEVNRKRESQRMKIKTEKDKGQEFNRKSCIRAERDDEYQALRKSLGMKTSTEI